MKQEDSVTTSRTLRGIAILELTKGVLVLLVGIGAAAALRGSFRRSLKALVYELFPKHQLVDWLGITRDNLGWIVLGALVYAAVRIVEAWGLWFGRTWAEWLALIGAALYVPFEIYELAVHHSITALVLLILNLAIIAYMAVKLREKRRLRAAAIFTAAGAADAAGR